MARNSNVVPRIFAAFKTARVGNSGSGEDVAVTVLYMGNPVSNNMDP